MKKKISIAAIALVGIITTIKLAIIYYSANFDQFALPSFCSINEFIDCDGIARTTESQFLGIPLAYWGMFYYAFVFVMLFADKLKNIKLFKFMEVFKNPLDYIASLGLFAFIVSMILLCLSLFDIKKLCILCAFTYILNLAIGCVATDFQNGGFVHSIKQSVQDFLDAIKIKKYLIAFIAVMAVAVGFLTYTRVTFKFAPQVKRQMEFKEFRHNEKRTIGLFKKLYNLLFTERYSLISADKSKVLAFAEDNAKKTYDLLIALKHNDKKKIPHRIYHKYQKILPVMSEMYKDGDFAYQATRNALKEYQKSLIFKNKLLKTFGGITALVLLANPINTFVDKQIMKKFISPGIDQLSKEVVSESNMKNIFNNMPKTNPDDKNGRSSNLLARLKSQQVSKSKVVEN